MPGDGVSLPTTLAQMGSVAKTQARAQQSSPQVTPFSEQKEDQEELRVHRVKESSAAEKNRVLRQDDEKDRRKRRRLKRNLKRAHHSELDTGEGQGAEKGPAETDQETLGSVIDLRV